MLFAGLGMAGVRAADPGTAFTYQGSLENPPGTPTTASCDFEFRLFNDSAGGMPVTDALAVNGVAVSSGLFTVGPPNFDFGAGHFHAEARWMKISVCCPSPCAPGGLQVLSPLVELTPTPFSLYSAAPWETSPGAVTYDGRVGIGEPAPTQPLDVAGDANFGGASGMFDGTAEFLEIRAKGTPGSWGL